MFDQALSTIYVQLQLADTERHKGYPTQVVGSIGATTTRPCKMVCARVVMSKCRFKNVSIKNV